MGSIRSMFALPQWVICTSNPKKLLKHCADSFLSELTVPQALNILSNKYGMQGSQLEPQLGSAKFALVVLELLVSSHIIMVMP